MFCCGFQGFSEVLTCDENLDLAFATRLDFFFTWFCMDTEFGVLLRLSGFPGVCESVPKRDLLGSVTGGKGLWPSHP